MKGKTKKFWNLFRLFFFALLLLTFTSCCCLIPKVYNITATFEEGGILEPAGEIVVSQGEEQVFVIIPDDGYRIAELLIDGLKVEPVSSYTFDNVTQDHSIHAKFEKIEKPSITSPSLKKYFITATAGEGGTIAPEGKISVTKRRTRTFTITPEDGYIISDIEVDGVSVGALTTYTFSNVQKDHTIHAEFVPCYKLTLESDKPEWGTVTDETGGDCYAEGTEVSISATAKDGYLFSHWEADAGTFDKENANETTFTMPEKDVTVTAVFVEKTYNLTVQPNNSSWGTAIDQTNSPPYIEGKKVIISAESNDDKYLFSHWEAAPEGTFDNVNESNTTFTMPAQDVTVTAVFKEIVTIVYWEFEDGEKRGNVSDSGNISSYEPDIGDGTISLVGATFDGFFQGSGGKGFAAHSYDWTNDNFSKYWQIEVSTENFKNLKLSSKQRSSATGPCDFIVEYSIDDGSSWEKVSNTDIEVANNFTKGVLDGVDLPVECDGKSSLYLRWLMDSNTNVDGGTVGNQGTSRIDDILLTGITID